MKTGNKLWKRFQPAFLSSDSRVAARELSRAIGVCVVAWVFGAQSIGSVSAGWNTSEETVSGKRTWIYFPSNPIETSPGAIDGKRALVVTLHGCDQTHSQLKEHGNWAAVADHYGAVVAIPWVENGYLTPQCWHYDGAKDSSNHARDVIALTRNLISRRSLNIDPRQVYVTGLSSGAAMALQVACQAPDVFAGVGAIAGPSVGSGQERALMGRTSLEVLDKFVPPPNVRGAINKCRELAGKEHGEFGTQIASLAYGDMDLDGPTPASGTAGQRALVSIKWTEDNVDALRSVYEAESPGTPYPIQNGAGSERVATVNGKPAISMVVVHNVGHAWPAGTGASNELGGTWIAQQGLNYPAYVASWFYGNNRRLALLPVDKPRIAVRATVEADDIKITGNAIDPGGNVVRIDVALDKLSDEGEFINVANDVDIAFVASTGEFQSTFNDRSPGAYRASVTAKDNEDNTTTETTAKLAVNSGPTQCEESTSSTWNHVSKDRAVACGLWHACALGSGDDLGLYNIYNIVTLAETRKGYYEMGGCPEQ